MSHISRGLLAAAATSALISPLAAAQGWEDVDFFGRAMLDYTIANSDTSDYDVSASEVRRARLGAKGEVSGVKFKLELNTDSGQEIEVTDGYLEFAPGDSDWNVRVGHFKTPNSLEEETSSRFMNTIERGAFTDAFELNRRVGVAVFTKRDDWTFFAGAYGANVNDTASEEGYALGARVTGTPVRNYTTTLHLGASVRYREKGDDQSLIRYRQRPYSHNGGRIVSTGRVAESDTFIGLEGAVISGSAFATAEYAFLDADGPIGGGDLSGGYIEGGYVLGGKKTYKGGKFDRYKVTNPVSEGGYGALALVARFDTLDMSDAPVDGGSLDTLILGADWLPTTHTRVRLNIFQSDAAFGLSDSGVDGAFAAARANGATGDEVTGAVMRVGFDF